MDSFYVLHVADQDDLEDVEEGGAGGLYRFTIVVAI